MTHYVHGYTDTEAVRLNDQAITLENILHHDSLWGPGETILEAGCGVGAQTQIIAAKNPNSQFVSLDISEASVWEAQNLIESLDIFNVMFLTGDIFNLPFPDEYFNHVFVCFVLEHLSDKTRALKELKRVLKTGGTLTVIEGDHGSTFFYPDCKEAHLAIQCQVELQKRHGGDANIGRQLYPLLTSANFENINVMPRMVYVDDSKPQLIEGFTKNTFTAMIEGIRNQVKETQLLDLKTFDKGVAGLYRTTHAGGIFCYTFFKAVAVK
jgi:ubiquinone/menaquinone biosynthesis C-methylase UbiE